MINLYHNQIIKIIFDLRSNTQIIRICIFKIGGMALYLSCKTP